MLAKIAELGHEEGMQDIFFGNRGIRKSMHASVRAIDKGLPPRLPGARLGFGDDVPFNPGAEERAFGDVIFLFARLGAKAAANAFVDVNGHPPRVFRWVITFRRPRRAETRACQ